MLEGLQLPELFDIELLLQLSATFGAISLVIFGFSIRFFVTLFERLKVFL